MAVPAIVTWLNDSNIGTGIRESTWVFPILETTHVLALTISVGLLVWFDLRLIGLGLRYAPVSRVHKQIMPWALAGFTIMAISGAFLFWSEAEKCYSSSFFRAKVLFLLLAGVNAVVFELTTKKSIEEWDKFPVPPRNARLAGLLSVILWLAVISAGRATAYNLF